MISSSSSPPVVIHDFQVVGAHLFSATIVSSAGFSVNFGFWDGSGTLQEIEIASLVSLLDVLHV